MDADRRHKTMKRRHNTLCIRTNFRADLISRIGHRFILRVFIFGQLSKTNFRAFLFSRTTIFSNLNKPKYFKEIGFDRIFINILRFC